MKHLRIYKIAAVCLALLLTVLFCSCSKLDEWTSGWLNELENLAGQMSQEEQGTDAEGKGEYYFTSTDFDGNRVSLSDFPDAKVIMINYWEPWCGPCLSELPELEQLYKAYSSEGLLIVGVFSTTTMDDDVNTIIEENNITYPMLRFEGALTKTSLQYVPTTIFIDADGNLLSEEPIVGADSFSGWEAVVKGYLD